MGLAKRRRHAIKEGFLNPRKHAPVFAPSGQMVPLCRSAGRGAAVAQTPASVSCERCLEELLAIEGRKLAHAQRMERAHREASEAMQAELERRVLERGR